MIHAHDILYYEADTVIHRLNPFFKVIASVILAAIIGFIENLSLLLGLTVFFLFLILMFRMKISVYLKRIRTLSLLFLFLSVFLIFSPDGEALYTVTIRSFKIGIYQMGLYYGASLTLRGLLVFSLFYILLCSTRIEHVLHVFTILRVPDNLVLIFYFTYHYILLYFDRMACMDKALILRGYNRRRRFLYVRSLLLGNLLLRCYDDTNRQFKAMILRGYSGRSYQVYKFEFVPLDFIFISGIVLFSAVYVLVDIVIF